MCVRVRCVVIASVISLYASPKVILFSPSGFQSELMIQSGRLQGGAGLGRGWLMEAQSYKQMLV